MRISMRSCQRSWFLMRFLMRFLILNDVLAQDLIEILNLEQSHWDFDEKIHFFPKKFLDNLLSDNVYVPFNAPKFISLWFCLIYSHLICWLIHWSNNSTLIKWFKSFVFESQDDSNNETLNRFIRLQEPRRRLPPQPWSSSKISQPSRTWSSEEPDQLKLSVMLPSITVAFFCAKLKCLLTRYWITFRFCTGIHVSLYDLNLEI